MPAAKNSKEIPASPLAPLMVQFLYERQPVFDMDRLTDRVQKYCGKIDPRQRPAANAKQAHYFMLEAMAQFAEGSLPSQLCLMPGDGMPSNESLAQGLHQTWDWDKAAETVQSCTATLIATDLMAGSVDLKIRNHQFRGFVRAIQEVAPCRAMHWLNTQLIVDPKRYLDHQAEDDQLGLLLYGSINVRFFNIEGSDGDFLMDTLGLGSLGLPDLQCHFHGLPPGQVGRVLYNTACYIFERGDIIEDGQTISGISEDNRWSCQHEMALAGPQRIVLDIHPGPGHAAGNRQS